MRRILRITFALVVLSVASALSAASAAAQTVDEIVAKNLQAKGGAEKWHSIKSVRMTGKMTAQGTEMPLTVYAMRPNFNRQEITMPAGKAVQAFDGTTAWVVNPMLGIDTPQPVPGPASESARHSADFDGALINYKEKGNTIELIGKEKLGSKDVYHLKVTTKGGVVQHYFLDAENGIELKMSAEVERGGQKHTVNTEMSDYRSIDGILIPHTVRQTAADGQTLLTWTISNVEFNRVADDSIFRMPKK